MKYLFSSILLLLSTSAYSGMVFDNGAPNGVSALQISLEGNITAGFDNFYFSNETTLTGIEIYGGEGVGNSSWSGEMDYIFFGDDNFLPDVTNIIGGGTSTAITRTATGNQFVAGGDDYDEYTYSFDFTDPLVFDAGMNFWVGLYTGGSSHVIWRTSSSTDGGAGAILTNATIVGGAISPFDLSFTLSGSSIPLPLPISLFALGLVMIRMSQKR